MKTDTHFFSIFIFRVMGENSSKIGIILSKKMTRTRKIKIAKIGNLVFLSIQQIFLSPPPKNASKVWEFFLGLVDPSWNRLVSTAFKNCLNGYTCIKINFFLQIYMKNLESAEQKEKIKFPMYIFRAMVIFVTSVITSIFDELSRKLEKLNQNIFFSFFILFSTFYVSLKNLTISEGEVCIKLVGTADLIKFILVYFLSILSTKSTISHKLKIGKLFSPRCNDFFPIKDMQTSPSPPRSGQIFMKDAGLFPT